MDWFSRIDKKYRKPTVVGSMENEIERVQRAIDDVHARLHAVNIEVNISKVGTDARSGQSPQS